MRRYWLAKVMFGFRKKRGAACLLGMALVAMLIGAPVTAEEGKLPEDTAALLHLAETDHMANFSEFGLVLEKLDSRAATLSPKQRLYLHFLNGWKAGYEGNHDKAVSLLQSVIDESDEPNLRLRAGFTLVNLLSDESHYEEAFVLLGKLLRQLPLITDPVAREKALASAAELYNEAGQYELALSYADQQLMEQPDGNFACIARYVRVAALFKSGQWEGIQSKFDQGIESCHQAKNHLYGNGIYFILASLDLKQNHPNRAIALLLKNYADVQRIAYPPLISQYNALLAQAYWSKDDAAQANHFALAAVGAMGNSEVAESLAIAYKVLYQVSRKSGDMASALGYHEKYMAADKGYLNNLNVMALDFQVVNQEVQAKKLQIDALNKKNQILELQQSLGAKSVETSRLYIILLLTILTSIVLWAYRLKRSQMSFRKLARRDGLTGIFNRQHFVESAERQLQVCQKSGREVGLIVIDLDNFKTVNDTYGHAVGDHILKRAVAACETNLRSTDVFGRLGGEEFGILMPECAQDIVAARADLIRRAIAKVPDGEDALGVMVSASFGVSSTLTSGYDLGQLLIHADKALYAAKHGGRNRVVAFAEEGRWFDEPQTALPLERT